MLFIESITGERPNRTFTFTALGRPGDPRKIAGEPAELSWRDATWSQQTRHSAEIQESELREALERLDLIAACALMV